MTKGRILHLEDNPEWIEHVRNLLGQDYELYSVKTLEEGYNLIKQLNEKDLWIDVAIIDISLVLDQAEDKQGIEFIEMLDEKTWTLPRNRIIVLSGYADRNSMDPTTNKLADVINKAHFVDEREKLKQKVAKIVDEPQENDPRGWKEFLELRKNLRERLQK